ncbi:hypothetical protein C4J97_0993 [Pseudomonas orientalis]|nr:hypothetical protein C4J97_0993 [Pseudomonas orientalis]
MWEGACPDGGVSVNRVLTDPPLSGASPLPHLFVFQIWKQSFIWRQKNIQTQP